MKAYEQALEVAHTITDITTKDYALRNISETLAARRNFEKALEVANTITDDQKDVVLSNISEKFAQNGIFDKALEVANTIKNYTGKI